MTSIGKHHDLVPRDIEANLIYRSNMMDDAKNSDDVVETIKKQCLEDPLFFIDSCLWTFNPKDFPDSPVRPVILHPKQVEAVHEVYAAIGHHDLVFEKSREQGITTLLIQCIGLHRWLFYEYQAILLVSRKMEVIDEPADMDALFQRLDFAYDHLPPWMKPLRFRKKGIMENKENHSTIKGTATVDDVGRGGKKTFIVPDEFAFIRQAPSMMAAIAGATASAFYISTHKGAATEFYRLTRNPSFKKMYFHWKDNPVHSLGLYFDADGKPRSPWYDNWCMRLNNDRRKIAQELDINPEGSADCFFDLSLIERLQSSTALPPFMVGELHYEEDTGLPMKFVEREGGPLKIWTPLLDGCPPFGEYAAGVDISSGTGHSNSVVVVVDRNSGQQAAEWCDPNVMPEEFAPIAVSVCRWFHDAFMVPEAGGPGGPFIKTCSRIGYENMYMRQAEERIDETVQMVYGWYPHPRNIYNLLVKYRESLAGGTFVNRSWDALEECKQYIYADSQTIMHSAAGMAEDPSGARNNHGDRAKACALANLGIIEASERAKEDSGSEPMVDVSKLNPRSHEHRFQTWKRQQREALEWG